MRPTETLMHEHEIILMVLDAAEREVRRSGRREDHILYPMADQLLLPEDQRALEAEFERVEREEIGVGVHEKYQELAHRLAGE